MSFISIGRLAIPTVRSWGWDPDPEEGNADDWPFEKSPMNDTTIGSESIDNSMYFKDISDQLYLPSCVANAVTDAWEAATITDKVSSGLALEQAKSSVPHLSRMFVWWNARNMMDPPRQKDATSGTYNRLGMATVAMFGIPTETRWPYDPMLATTRPSIMSYREARQFTNGSFYAINTTKPDVRIEQVIKALRSQHNVVFGTALAIGFPQYESGILRRPTLTNGRHAMVIVGYNGKAFKVRNSWTPGWGEDGYCWLHEDYIGWSKSGGFWVPTKGIAL